MISILLLPSISPAGLSAIAIAAGSYHTCAIAAGGGVKCWGGNWYGQLGIGSNENQNRPADVTGTARGAFASGLIAKREEGWFVAER